MGSDLNLEPETARKFAKALRKERKRRGHTQDTLAAAVGCSRPTVTRYESGRHLPHRDLAQDFDNALGAGGYLVSLLPDPSAEQERLERLTKFVDMEGEARDIHQFQCQVVPALGQTEAYARSVLGASLPPKGAAEIDLLVQQRLHRQRLFDREDPVRIHFVVDESALRRMVGGTHVMLAQWEHLLKLSTHPGVRLQVMPFSEGAHAELVGSYTLMETESQGQILYLETLATGNIVTDPASIALTRQKFDSLAANSLSEKGTRAFLRGVIEEAR
jgi:transcriptional regulator with XRE-family HTH domain